MSLRLDGLTRSSDALGVFTLLLTLTAPGCLQVPSVDGIERADAATAGPAVDAGTHALVGADLATQTKMNATLPDASLPPADMSHAPADLAPSDLAGLFDCYGRAICNPTQDFCLKFHGGSPSAPGTSALPACYAPANPCADTGQAMSCGCIQADDTLGASCQGACVDNMNGTFDCYARP